MNKQHLCKIVDWYGYQLHQFMIEESKNNSGTENISSSLQVSHDNHDNAMGPIAATAAEQIAEISSRVII